MTRCVWIGRDLPKIHRDGMEYFVLAVDDELFLVHNRCPHRGGPLKSGNVNQAEELVCPMHGNCFPINALLSQKSTLRLRDVPANP